MANKEARRRWGPRPLERRYEAAQNFCPVCKAFPGSPCKRNNGETRLSVHRARMGAPKATQKEKSGDLVGLVREKELELFPEFRTSHEIGLEGTREGVHYFTPSHHFKTGLMTKDILDNLLDGKKLLSFGAGNAYLERLLVSGFEVKSEQIVLVDDYTSDLPQGFETYEADMHGEWPDFGTKFSYVIFPESFGVSLMPYERAEEEGKESEQVRRAITLIERCFDILAENGEVRIDGHCMREEDEIPLVRKALADKGISLEEHDKGLLVAKKSAQSE